MTIEDRLVEALRSADRIEPSPDLWSRVVHSIEEDRAHRRRVVMSMIGTVGVLAIVVLVGAFSTVDGVFGTIVRPGVLEVLETVLLVVLVLVLGPAIRRFGRGYADDLWSATPTTSAALVRLLDVAYLLVFFGLILMTAKFDTTVHDGPLACLRDAVDCPTLQSQLRSAAERVGALLLTMGLLHAVTLVVLPVIALVSNSTRRGRPLPRALVVVLVVGGAWIGIQLLLSIPILLIGASGG